MPRRRISVTVAALVTMVLVLVGCTSQLEAPAPSTSAEIVEIPSTPVGDTARWVIDAFNADAEVSAALWEARLHPDFLAEVSADEIVQLLGTQIRPARPFVVTAYNGGEREAVVTLAGKVGDPFDLSLVVDTSDKITGLLLAPTAPPHTPAQSLGEITERLEALPGDVRALVTLDGKEVIAVDTDQAAPLGSIFKLYVLLAVADAVTAGTISWDQPLQVSDEVRSLPSGRLQDAETGTTVTVQEAAELMISISDNTATDMLIGLVGREAVEAAVVTANHHDPALLRPFLTTRELFGLLWGGNDEISAAWPTADEGARRALLNDLATRPFDIDLSSIDLNSPETTPQFVDGVEWFASAQDIVAVHAALRDRGAQDATVTGALTMNPGITINPELWPSVSFKGGSSPGVLTGSWDAVRDDNAKLAVVLLLSDTTGPVSSETQSELFGLGADLFTLLGSEG